MKQWLQIIHWRIFCEPCDGYDNDLDGHVDEGFPDTDADGFADCVDTETCDGLDNDGDGAIDEGFTQGTGYSWSQSGGGNAGGGHIEHTFSTYDSATDTLSFGTTIQHTGGRTANFLTVAINDGPNPKGFSELALVYFDATGPTPIVTVYAYNGQNTVTSYFDGSSQGGIQPPDRIVSSLVDDSFLLDAWADDDGTRVEMGFTVDVGAINDHTPLYTAPYDWTGLFFDDLLGIWFHPSTNASSSYSADGWLTNYSFATQGGIDNANRPTTSTDSCAPE